MIKSFALVLIVLMVVLVSPQTIKADSNDFIVSEQGAFVIQSPLNRTYNTNALTLNLTFAAFFFQYTFECFVDGKFQGDAPYTVNVSGTHIQYPGKASMNLPLLSEGSHILKVVMYSNAPQKGGPYTAIVYFTVNTIAKMTSPTISNLPTQSPSAVAPTQTPDAPEFSFLIVLPLFFSMFLAAVILRLRKTANLSKR
jgi:hypothetical protein